MGLIDLLQRMGGGMVSGMNAVGGLAEQQQEFALAQKYGYSLDEWRQRKADYARQREADVMKAEQDMQTMEGRIKDTRLEDATTLHRNEGDIAKLYPDEASGGGGLNLRADAATQALTQRAGFGVEPDPREGMQPISHRPLMLANQKATEDRKRIERHDSVYSSMSKAASSDTADETDYEANFRAGEKQIQEEGMDAAQRAQKSGMPGFYQQPSGDESAGPSEASPLRLSATQARVEKFNAKQSALTVDPAKVDPVVQQVERDANVKRLKMRGNISDAVKAAEDEARKEARGMHAFFKDNDIVGENGELITPREHKKLRPFLDAIPAAGEQARTDFFARGKEEEGYLQGGYTTEEKAAKAPFVEERAELAAESDRLTVQGQRWKWNNVLEGKQPNGLPWPDPTEEKTKTDEVSARRLVSGFKSVYGIDALKDLAEGLARPEMEELFDELVTNVQQLVGLDYNRYPSEVMLILKAQYDREKAQGQ